MTIADKLNEKRATPETVLQILKTSVFEASGDLSPREMEAVLEEAVGKEAVRRAREKLAEKPGLVREVALLWIGDAADDPDRAEMVDGAIISADREMAILDLGLITLAALYAMYLIAPAKPRKTKRRVELRQDGTFVVSEDFEAEGFGAAVGALLGLFRGSSKAD